VSVPFNRRGEGRSEICDSQRIPDDIVPRIRRDLRASDNWRLCRLRGTRSVSLRFEVQSSVMLPHTASPTRKIVLGSPESFHVYLVYDTVPGHEEQLIRISR